MGLKPNKDYTGTRIGRGLEYVVEVDSIDDIVELAKDAVEELRSDYETMKKVSSMTVNFGILMNKPPEPQPLPDDLKFIEVPDDAPKLTEQEKWECTARWLNSSYRAFVDGTRICDDEHPCNRCPLYETKCIACHEPTHMNFKVIEQFTGPDTMMGRSFDSGI